MTTEREYEGHTIKLDDYDDNSSMCFQVSGPLFEGDHGGQRSFDTYKQAKDEIDKRLKSARQQQATNLSLEVLKHDASGVTKIKGIHARHGTLLFTDGAYSKEASESYSKIDYVYPNVQWIADLLHERTALYKRRDEIDKKLRDFRIKKDWCYGSRVRDPDGYAEEIARLVKEHDQKSLWAKQTNDQGQAA